MLTPKQYVENCQIYARGLDAEGWSQTVIVRELGVPQQTIDRWLHNGPIGP